MQVALLYATVFSMRNSMPHPSGRAAAGATHPRARPAGAPAREASSHAPSRARVTVVHDSGRGWPGRLETTQWRVYRCT